MIYNLEIDLPKSTRNRIKFTVDSIAVGFFFHGNISQT